MKIVVTGGYGFLGSSFIRTLMKDTDFLVRNIDKHTYAARPESLEEVLNNTVYNKRYEFFNADIAKKNEIEGLVKDADYVVNFAAESHVDRSIGRWEEKEKVPERVDQSADNVFVYTNIIGTKNLLECTLINKHIKKFIQISTDEVYGTVTEPSKEIDMLNPSNPYSATKMGAEAIVNAYKHTYGLPVIVTRSCNNFGPWQSSEKFIPVIILQALSNQKIPVYGSGKNVRDWIYVDDNSLAILHLLEKGKIGETYNIPAGNYIENKDLVLRILRMIGKPEDLIQYTIDRPGHDLMYRMDGSKLRHLGFSLSRSLEQGLEKTIGFYKSNEKYYRRDMARSEVNKRIEYLLRK